MDFLYYFVSYPINFEVLVYTDFTFIALAILVSMNNISHSQLLPVID